MATRTSYNVGAGIVDMTVKVLTWGRVRKAALTQEARMEESDETPRQDGRGLEVLQHAGATKGGEPEKHQLQQQPHAKPKLQLKQQYEEQYELWP